MQKNNRYSVVIVTHNSQAVIGKCIENLLKQTFGPTKIVVIDSSSKDPEYLQGISALDERIVVQLEEQNVGFCRANNIGYEKLASDLDGYVLFLNPDAFVPDDCLEKCLNWLGMPANQGIGIATPLLAGWDLSTNSPSGKIDSAGISATWYGKWFDKYQGCDIEDLDNPGSGGIKAICGAFMLCRKSALVEIFSRCQAIFPEEFYMYKEDIYLSLYLRRLGWGISLIPNLLAYHCRGWKQDRQKMPKNLRLHAAANDLTIAKQFYPRYLPWAIMKYFYVRVIE